MVLTRKFFFMALMVIVSGFWLTGQIENKKIEVINVEVPVRVFLDGVPVAGLTKDDFQLFEGKQKQDINGFYVRKKKLAVENAVADSGKAPLTVPGRYIVLVFRIIEYNEQMAKGIDYFFEHMLRANDQLLVMVNDRTLELSQDVSQSERRELLTRILHEEATKAMKNLETFFSVNRDLDQTKMGQFGVDGNFSPSDLINFLERYIRTWEGFKKKYLLPDLDSFYNFARHLEKINKEKWVLSFYQIERFPSMKIRGGIRKQIEDLIEESAIAANERDVLAKILAKLLERIDRWRNVAGDFPVKEVSKMLAKVDTTFYSFIINVQRDVLSEDLEYKQVSTEIENLLRGIATQSGGEVFFSGDIGASLHSVAEREDIYYVLTYEPKDPAKRKSVRIKLADPQYQLFYDDNVRADYIGEYLMKRKAQDPILRLKELQWAGSKLQLELVDFKMAETAEGLRGNLNLTVRIRNEQNQQLYDQSRTFFGKDGRVSAVIDFSWLKPGKYMFLVEARDLLSEKAIMDVLQVKVE